MSSRYSDNREEGKIRKEGGDSRGKGNDQI